MKPSAFLLSTVMLATGAGILAQTPTVRDVSWQIRREALEHSQIMKTLHVLTDVYGPRLTGSPNAKQAGEWAARQMESWGLVNAHLEPWNFGHPGWLNERFTAHLVSPVNDALVGEVLAWTPSTNGPVHRSALQLTPPDRPTAESLTSYLERVGDAVKDRIVLVGTPKVIGVTIVPPAKRLDDNDARARFDPVSPTPSPFANQTPPTATPGVLTSNQVNEQIDRFLVDHHAAVRVNDAGREHGQIRAFNNRAFDPATTVPTIILRNEDYGRIWRLLADQRQVELDVDVVNHVYPEGATSYNTVAEISGSDKATEVVMLGAHLDSWHAATGATDNAIGCAVMMEAARILETLGVKPRRTIRVALWSGEEEGLLGSKAYVAEHFGTFESPKPDYDRLDGYINIDSGTGRIRGLTVFGPPEAADVIRTTVAPLADLGVAGAIATKSRRTGGTDSTSFNAAGLPGIGSAQDPIEYQTHTWHTNLDTYERIIEDDVQKAAIVVATTVYALAMRDEPLRRFSKDEMPKAEPETPATPTPATPPRPATSSR
jgi:carboxypeptidase Q